MIDRRSLITGLISFAVTAPAIVRSGNLMPVKSIKHCDFLTLEEYCNRIIQPMIEKFQNQIADAVFYGTGYNQIGIDGNVKYINIAGLLNDIPRTTCTS